MLRIIREKQVLENLGILRRRAFVADQSAPVPVQQCLINLNDLTVIRVHHDPRVAIFFDHALILHQSTDRRKGPGLDKILSTVDQPIGCIRRRPLDKAHFDKSIGRIIQNCNGLGARRFIHRINVFQINAGIAIAQNASKTAVCETLKGKKL